MTSRMEAEMALTAKQHLALHDKQVAAIRDLVREGIAMVREIRQQQLETRKDLRALAAAQLRNEANLERLIRSLERSGNGHKKQ